MALDGLVTCAIATELASKCVGGRITKIYQPNENDILLQIRSQRENLRMILSVNPTYPRAHLTNHSFHNPTEPPMFCMLLRKHCEGGIIESIQQIDLERILHIEVRSRDELGDESSKRIVVELMGRHSNLILIDPATNQILESVHHVTPAISRHRIVLPGRPYVQPPEQSKLNPLTVKKVEWLSSLDFNQGKLDKQIVELFSGVSPLIAREIVHRTGLPTQEQLWLAFTQVMEPIAKGRFEPNIVRGEKDAFSIVDLTHIEGEKKSFSSISLCLDAFFHDKAERDSVKQRVGDLIRFLTNEQNKNKKKIEKLKETMKEAESADEFRIYGELLTASLHQLKRGDKQAQVLNYYDEEQRLITISLDPQLSPSENAQRYFKKYTKAKNSVAVVEEQIIFAKQEIDYLEALLQQLETASMADIEEIREELVEGGYVRDRNKRGRNKKKTDKPVLSQYQSSEGVTIFVGKNNKQNEYLTNRLASPNDTWLHTKDIPGSHVVIRAKEYGEATLHEAALLSAYFSKARSGSQIPVDYTLIRHVKKPSGAKPGYVIYDHQKTLYVTPDEDQMKLLLQSHRAN